MAFATLEGVELYWERIGQGDPVILVPGGFQDHTQWMAVAPGLAKSFSVVSFDPRGHGQSGGRVDADPLELVRDLAALIEQLDLAPVHVVAQSGGGLQALQLAARRPELARSLCLHEPAMMGLLKGESRARAASTFTDITARFQQGDYEGGLAFFFPQVGADWSLLPPPFQQALARNATNYAGAWFGDFSHTFWQPDLGAVAASRIPILLSRGADTSPLLHAVEDAVEAALPAARTLVLDGTAHAPMFDQPEVYTRSIESFLRTAS